MSENQDVNPAMLVGYCIKTKTKGVPILDAVLKPSPKGAVMVLGHDADGNKMSAICSRAKAEAAVAAGVATWAEELK